MPDDVWGAFFGQTMMDRFLTLLGQPQRCKGLVVCFSSKGS